MEREWFAEHRAAALAAQYQALLAGYQVQVDHHAPDGKPTDAPRFCSACWRRCWRLARPGAHEVRPGFLELRETGANVFPDDLEGAGARRVPSRHRAAISGFLPHRRRADRDPGRGRVHRTRRGALRTRAGRQHIADRRAGRHADRRAGANRARGRHGPDRTPDAVRSGLHRRRPSRALFGAADLCSARRRAHPDRRRSLLFVLCLLLLVRSSASFWPRSPRSLAHSITLAAATLGFIHVPAAPVEATIALSIVFLASELLRAGHGAE